jgi:hypothetical protein
MHTKQEAKRFQKQVERETRWVKKLINHWCPKDFQHEGFPGTLMRAFMHATACCADQRRRLDGVEPIRPLSSYPDPMVGFKNTQTGQEGSEKQAWYARNI